MTRMRTITTALALVATLGLAACSGGEESTTNPTQDGAPTQSTGEDETTQTPTASGDSATGTETGGAGEATTGSGEGCAGTDDEVPDGAASGETTDLDGDGQPDELWLSAGSDRELGVRTATGAVFSVEFSAGAPQAATALGQRLGDGSAIVLLNTGRSVSVYAVVDCELMPTMNPEGDQYTFDLGFTGYGTGVGCVDLADGGCSSSACSPRPTRAGTASTSPVR